MREKVPDCLCLSGEATFRKADSKDQTVVSSPLESASLQYCNGVERIDGIDVHLDSCELLASIRKRLLASGNTLRSRS